MHEQLTGKERRLAPRVPTEIEIDYRSEDTYLFAYITDISALGIFVRTNVPEPPGTRLKLSFRPPGASHPFAVEGVVMWNKPVRSEAPDQANPGMGIEFTDLDEETRRQLLSLVNRMTYLHDQQCQDVEPGD